MFFLIQAEICASQIRTNFIFKFRSLSRISCVGLVWVFLSLRFGVWFFFFRRCQPVRKGLWKYKMVFCTVKLHVKGPAVTPPVSCKEVIFPLVTFRECTAQHFVVWWYCSVERNCSYRANLVWDPQPRTADASAFIFTTPHSQGFCV